MNAIAPGFVKTRMLDGVPDKAMDSVLDMTPVGDWATRWKLRRAFSIWPLRRRASSRVTCSTSMAAWRCDERHRPPAGSPLEVIVTSFFDIVSDQQLAWLTEQQRAWQRMLSLPRVIELACETQVGSSAARRGVRDGDLRLLRYRRQTPAVTPNRCCFVMRSSTGTTSSIFNRTRASSSATSIAGSTST